MAVANIPNGAPMRDAFLMLEARLDALEEEVAFDQELRRQNPALQDLYEKYQTTKRLIADAY